MLKHKQRHTVPKHCINGIDIAVLNVYLLCLSYNKNVKHAAKDIILFDFLKGEDSNE
jgi:hypothetical protein